MSKFTKQIKRSYSFQDDTVLVSMKRLKRKDAIKLAPFMSEPDEDGKVKMSFESSLNFADKACEVLSKYTTSFEGLKEEDGTPLEVVDIFGEDGSTYFMELISEMMADLMEASFVGGEDTEKKLDAPLVDTLNVCDTKTQPLED